jgi:ElaA protein
MSVPRADADRKAVAGPELSARQLHDILRLRVDVFVVEQDCPYPEIDGHDLCADTEHVWIADGGGVAAYVRLLAVGSDSVKVGRVVTRPDRRGQSLARHLIHTCLERLGEVETRLHAQTHLVEWYRSLGYEPDGAEFIEDGIPHTPMVRLPPPADRPARP